MNRNYACRSFALLLLAGIALTAEATIFEAETATLNGSAIVGNADGSSRAVGTLAGEASGRQAVTLPVGASLTLQAPAGSNAVVVRYSIPDGFTNEKLTLTSGAVTQDMMLTSKYAWLYGASATPQAQHGNTPTAYPTKLYDEVQVLLPNPNTVSGLVTFTNNGTQPQTIDFVEFESVPSGTTATPAGFVMCNGLTPGTHSAFTGIDDTATTDSAVILQATSNATALNGCLTSNRNIYVPKGLYYMSGNVTLPSNTTIQGAGMWYTQFVAVGTEGMGNPTFQTSGLTAINNVALSDFSMFGNMTQRVDSSPALAVKGYFTDSTFKNLWLEHYQEGLQTIGHSNNVTYDGSRARNTFADGLVFYGGTTNSTMKNCQARGTGDDGLTLWSQQASNSVAQQASGNTIDHCAVSLNWFGHGLGVFGGINNKVLNTTVTDTVVYPCIRTGNPFITFDATNMTAEFDSLVLTRCGSIYDKNNDSYAIVAGAVYHNIDVIALNFSNITVNNPSYGVLQIVDKNVTPDNIVFNTSLTNVTATSAPNCIYVYDNHSNWPYLTLNNVTNNGTGCQSVRFSTNAPGAAVVAGATYTPTAMSTAGLAPVITLDATSTGCALSAGVVSFTAVGTCKVNVNQAGSPNYSAAMQVQQSFTVFAGGQDSDNDSIIDLNDNCPFVSNATQTNTDGDAQGDACDADDDNDGVLDANDAFPLDAKESVDTDGDHIGNNADLDDDGDNIPDYIDADPLNAAIASEKTLQLNGGFKGSSINGNVLAQ